MKHARADYNRIQDPAANPALLAAFDHAGKVFADWNTGEAFDALSDLCKALWPILLDVMHNPPAHPIAVDEPVFLLRASDCHAPEVIERWGELVYKRGQGNGELSRMASELADDMRRWQSHHGSKEPDA